MKARLGTLVEHLTRLLAEQREIIESADRWRELRLLRNAIAHDYLIESADRVLHEALTAAPGTSGARTLDRCIERIVVDSPTPLQRGTRRARP